MTYHELHESDDQWIVLCFIHVICVIRDPKEQKSNPGKGVSAKPFTTTSGGSKCVIKTNIGEPNKRVEN